MGTRTLLAATDRPPMNGSARPAQRIRPAMQPQYYDKKVSGRETSGGGS